MNTSLGTAYVWSSRNGRLSTTIPGELAVVHHGAGCAMKTRTGRALTRLERMRPISAGPDFVTDLDVFVANAEVDVEPGSRLRFRLGAQVDDGQTRPVDHGPGRRLMRPPSGAAPVEGDHVAEDFSPIRVATASSLERRSQPCQAARGNGPERVPGVNPVELGGRAAGALRMTGEEVLSTIGGSMMIGSQLGPESHTTSSAFSPTSMSMVRTTVMLSQSSPHHLMLSSP